MTGVFSLIGVCTVLSAVHVQLADPNEVIASFTFTESRVLLGSSGNLTLTCLAASKVNKVYEISLFRENPPGSNVMSPLASIENEKSPKLAAGISNFIVGGRLNSSMDGVARKLTVTIDKTKLSYNDARMYYCTVAFKDTETSPPQVARRNITLIAFEKENTEQASSGSGIAEVVACVIVSSLILAVTVWL